MVSAINSLNQYPIDKEMLEVVRRLQSLGVAPTGNLILDRQHLQQAELVKKQTTLASNSEVNLTKLEGSGKDFSSTFDIVKNIQKTQQTGDIAQNNGLTDKKDSGIAVNLGIPSIVDGKSERLQYEMAGASQIAELNKLKLGLIA